MGLAELLGGGPEPAQLLDRLHEVIDPELGVNIVDLGLIYGIELTDGLASVRMTMTTPACPIGPYLSDQVRWSLLELEGIFDVAVEITHEPPWSPERMSDAARMQLGWPR